MSDVLKHHPAPWTVEDPGYRPTYLKDANGDTILHVRTGSTALVLAQFIVSAVNAKALAKGRNRKPRSRLVVKGGTDQS